MLVPPAALEPPHHPQVAREHRPRPSAVGHCRNKQESLSVTVLITMLFSTTKMMNPIPSEIMSRLSKSHILRYSNHVVRQLLPVRHPPQPARYCAGSSQTPPVPLPM